MNKLKYGIIPLLICLSIISCKKDAGPGGLASIRGKVFATDVTTGGNVKDSAYIGGQRVYISVTNDPYHFDDIRTSYDGSYEFKFLRKGTYDVWTYSDCDTCLWKQKKEMIQGIKITEKKQSVTVEDIKIIF
jgi:hypothetical protein